MLKFKNIDLKNAFDDNLVIYLFSYRYVIVSGCILALIGMLAIINNSSKLVVESPVTTISFIVILIVIILISVVIFMPYLWFKNILKSKNLVFSVKKVDTDCFSESGMIKKNKRVTVFNFLSNEDLRILVQKKKIFSTKNYDDQNGIIIFINKLNNNFDRVIIKPAIGSMTNPVVNMLTKESLFTNNVKLKLFKEFDDEFSKHFLIYSMSENNAKDFAKSNIVEFINHLCELLQGTFCKSEKSGNGFFCPIEISLYKNKMVLFIRNLNIGKIIFNCEKSQNENFIDDIIKLINPLILKT